MNTRIIRLFLLLASVMLVSSCSQEEWTTEQTKQVDIYKLANLNNDGMPAQINLYRTKPLMVETYSNTSMIARDLEVMDDESTDNDYKFTFQVVQTIPVDSLSLVFPYLTFDNLTLDAATKTITVIYDCEGSRETGLITMSLSAFAEDSETAFCTVVSSNVSIIESQTPINDGTDAVLSSNQTKAFQLIDNGLFVNTKYQKEIIVKANDAYSSSNSDCSGFEVTVNGEQVATRELTVSPSNASVLRVKIAQAICKDDVVKIAFNGKGIKSASGRPLEAFTARSVVNNLTDNAPDLSYDDDERVNYFTGVMFGFDSSDGLSAMGWWTQNKMITSGYITKTNEIYHKQDGYSLKINVFNEGWKDIYSNLLFMNSATYAIASIPAGTYELIHYIYIDGTADALPVGSYAVNYKSSQMTSGWPDMTNGQLEFPSETGTWVKQSCQVKFDSEQTKFQFRFFFDKEIATGCRFYIDTIELRKVED